MDCRSSLVVGTKGLRTFCVTRQAWPVHLAPPLPSCAPPRAHASALGRAGFEHDRPPARRQHSTYGESGGGGGVVGGKVLSGGSVEVGPCPSLQRLNTQAANTDYSPATGTSTCAFTTGDESGRLQQQRGAGALPPNHDCITTHFPRSSRCNRARTTACISAAACASAARLRNA